jgi:hypothetical protein
MFYLIHQSPKQKRYLKIPMDAKEKIEKVIQNRLKNDLDG